MIEIENSENLFDISNENKIYSKEEAAEIEPEPKEEEPVQTSSEPIVRSFLITEDKIYLSVMDNDGWPQFAYMEKGQISYASNIQKDGLDVYPRQLPINNGSYVPIVGVPISGYIDEAPDVEPEELFELLHIHMKKYIDAPEIDMEMYIHFILFTWLYKKLNTTPYLRFIGDTGKGKSRFLRVVSDLCFYPMNMEGASTISAISRFKEQWNGTLKIDEADINGGTENSMIKYLNLGFEEGHYIAKTNVANHQEQEFFDPFCPKVIAMRKPFLDMATEGRLLSFAPRETTRTDIPSNLPPEYNEQVDKIRGIITRFVLQNWNRVDPNNLIDCSDMEIEGRLKQLTVPLSLTLQLLPDGEERFKDYMARRQDEVKQVRSQSWEGTIFNYVFALAKGEDEPHPDFAQYSTDDGIAAVTPSMVAKHIGASTKAISQALGSIGITTEQTTVRLQTGSKKVRQYVVPDENTWREIVRRYYYTDEELEDRNPDCPEVLRSRRYGVSMN
ncbi:hypothetical protein [uncultured Methanolobus sp.]|uniref:hypothetical protein n=1 Tax=uncultured Methanolobus sp. TaxID=218300 RepID=UPI0029C95551|nr:hypothetical protein [uncultured Methanolobus sp.]